ncbi:CrcB protein [Corynebacterium mycetoides]|uniref:Fluoride-specific ion channel FluC n=1 Tax=Corynebacterium mycetoides TaxID=38302 RepID=A0A1G9NWN9_9CORY|nr:CrcB family protein [Corynebacterium mycetoides]SDL91042.1 CrcB protein [Corynebacterium mycetoides]
MIVSVLLVAVGGFIGGVSRWALSHLPGATTGTWAANVVGSAVLGFAVAAPGWWPLLLGTGVAGALSTLSTLARELGELIRAGQRATAARYALTTAVACLVSAFFGLRYGALAFG